MSLKIKKKVFVLGTAQLFSNYGATNSLINLSKKESFKILDCAWQNGIRYFDTAPSYNSQKFIGEFIKVNKIEKQIKVFSKISFINIKKNINEQIKIAVEKNIYELNTIPKINFIHDRKNIKNFEKIYQNYDLIKSSIGISIYNNNEVLKKFKNIYYQFPSNFLDNRFKNNQIPKNYRIARSLFLQGILVSKLNKHSKNKKRKLITKFQDIFFNICKENKIDIIEFNLSHMLNQNYFEYFIIGVNSVPKLKKLLKSNYEKKKIYDKINFQLFKNSKSLIRPYNW